MTNKKLYLIGDPVDHSLSPLLHGAMIAQTGVHYTYEVRRVQPRDLADFVAEAKAGGCAGFNVTMPHKEAILPLLDELSPAAAACGAVNTVCIKNGRAIGYNTDGRGFVDSLRARGLEPEGKTVLLLGTGGAGDAICDALVGAGVKKIFVTNRSVYPAQDLAARYPDKAQFIYFGIFPVRHAMAESDLFINATSLGMAGMKEFSDLGFLRDAPAGVTVYDLVYNPRQTMLLREAEKRGLLNLKTTPDCVPYLLKEKNVRLFTTHKIYSETELHARYEIMLENYSKVLRIEALTMLEMVNTDILPAVSDYTAKLVRTAEDKKALLGSAAGGYEQKTAARLSSLTEIASEDAAKLDDALLQAGDLPTAQEAASFYQAEVFKDMTELRLAVDEMETLTSRACWPYPSYGDLLFSVR